MKIYSYLLNQINSVSDWSYSFNLNKEKVVLILIMFFILSHLHYYTFSNANILVSQISCLINRMIIRSPNPSPSVVDFNHSVGNREPSPPLRFFSPPQIKLVNNFLWPLRVLSIYVFFAIWILITLEDEILQSGCIALWAACLFPCSGRCDAYCFLLLWWIPSRPSRLFEFAEYEKNRCCLFCRKADSSEKTGFGHLW